MDTSKCALVGGTVYETLKSDKGDSFHRHFVYIENWHLRIILNAYSE